MAAGFPCPAPDQFGLDGFEERLDNGIVMTVKVRDRHASMKSHLARCRGNLMVDKSTQLHEVKRNMGQAIELRYHIHSHDNCPCHSLTTAIRVRAEFSGNRANSIGCHGRNGKCSPAAGNWVAFFRMSLSSFRIRTPRRSRSFSRARSRSSAETTPVPRCALTHLFRVEKPTPRSSAT